MRHIFTYLLFIASFTSSYTQESISDVLDKFNTESVPYIYASELNSKEDIFILDAREFKEYEVSHLKNAIFIGYSHFNIQNIKSKIKNKDQNIVVYCSLGIRSEDIAEQLKNEGYANVYNLFGGIFEWKNNNFDLYNSKNQLTENVHVFSKQWSKWLLKGKKIYD